MKTKNTPTVKRPTDDLVQAYLAGRKDGASPLPTTRKPGEPDPAALPGATSDDTLTLLKELHFKVDNICSALASLMEHEASESEQSVPSTSEVQ